MIRRGCAFSFGDVEVVGGAPGCPGPGGALWGQMGFSDVQAKGT